MIATMASILALKLRIPQLGNVRAHIRAVMFRLQVFFFSASPKPRYRVETR
jgi:hypothetical protein